MKKELPKVYEPQEVESRIYETWEKNGCFKGRRDPKRKPFTIVMPPPNVTGQLHMGHAMDSTLQDILIRFKRMQGYAALWVPGTDHAGIATQIKVEEELRVKEGLTRYDLGRDKFLERVWDWKHQYGNRIVEQQKKLGASCDWDRARFTMDEGCSKAVRETFCELYEKGLIYKGSRIINWCPHCVTALSDAEVEYQDKPGHLWYIRYPLTDGSGDLVVATTRPETMMGDTGVAVNPEDERFKHLVGKTCILPIMNREIPIVADEYVELGFGTGAVKMTPAHDPNDFEVGLRHNLETIRVLDDNGVVNANGGKYEGMDRYECRQAIVKDLEEQGYLVKTEPYSHNVGTCYRCHNDVEPIISAQWFVKMKPLAEEAIRVVEQGETKFVPDRFSKTYLNWMENVHDWCISRQLWWGHQIPVWYCADCGKPIVTDETIEAVSKLFGEKGSNAWYEMEAKDILPQGFTCPHCEKNSGFTKEEDTLDGWFDSGSTHFASMQKDQGFWPATVYMEGLDQYRGWFQSSLLTAVGALGKGAPFQECVTHGWTVDGEGKAMHKSLGNGVDPAEIFQKYGADMIRLWAGSADYHVDVRCSDKIFKQLSQNYLKFRNTARYCLGNLAGFHPDELVKPEEMLELDRWAVTKLNELIEKCFSAYDNYEFHVVSHAINDFCVVELSSFYLDIIKDRLYCEETDGLERRSAQTALWLILDTMTKLFAPILAFTCDEIWQAMPHRGEEDGRNVILNEMNQPFADYALSPAEMEKWALVEDLRDDVNVVLENARNEKKIGKALEAHVVLYPQGDEGKQAMEKLSGFTTDQLADLFIVSDVEIAQGTGAAGVKVPGIQAAVSEAKGEKCERCWKHHIKVGADKEHPTLCPRCARVIRTIEL